MLALQSVQIHFPRRGIAEGGERAMRNIEDLCPRSSYEEKACIISLLTQLVPTVEPELLLSQNDAPLPFNP